MKILPHAIGIFLSVQVVVPFAQAQWSAADDLAVCTSDSTQMIQSVISDDHGGVWVIWRTRIETLVPRMDSNSHGLQHVNSNGYRLLPENGITLNDSLQTYRIFAAYPTDSGGLTICYNGNIRTTNTYKSYLQRFTRTGEREWGYEGRPLSLLPGNVLAAYPTGDGDAYIAIGCRGNGHTTDIYIQRVLADGSFAFGNNGVLVNSDYNQAPNTHFQLFPRDEGGVWFGVTTMQGEIHLNGIDTAGERIYALPGVGLEHSWSQRYLITSRRDSANRSGMMFYSVSTDSLLHDQLRLHLVDTSGQEITPSDGRVLTDTSVSSLGDILPQMDGSVIYSYRRAGSTSLVSNCTSPSGVDCWEAPILFDRSDNVITNAWFTQDSTGMLVTWDHGDTGRTIYAQLLSASGIKQWDSDARLGSSHANVRKTPIHARDPYGNCIVCWTDSRNEAESKEDIFCTKVLVSSWIVTTGEESVQDDRGSLRSLTYPNPVTEVATFHVALSEGQPLKLDIYNALGRIVYSQYDLQGMAGENTIMVSVRNVPPGAYYYSLSGKELVHTGEFLIQR